MKQNRPGSSLVRNPERAAEIAEILKALAHPVRLRIVAVLCRGEKHVGGIAKELGAGQPAVSQHLSLLRHKNVVGFRWEEGRAVYSLKQPRLIQVLGCMEDCK